MTKANCTNSRTDLPKRVRTRGKFLGMLQFIRDLDTIHVNGNDDTKGYLTTSHYKKMRFIALHLLLSLLF